MKKRHVFSLVRVIFLIIYLVFLFLPGEQQQFNLNVHWLTIYYFIILFILDLTEAKSRKKENIYEVSNKRFMTTAILALIYLIALIVYIAAGAFDVRLF